MANLTEPKERISVPKFGEWDHKDPASTNYSKEFSQARANRKQRRDVWRSLGNEHDLAAVSLRHDNQDSVTDNKTADNSMSMSRGRPDRKQLMTKASHSLGNEQEFGAVASAPHRHDNDNDNDPAMRKRSISVPEFGGWDIQSPRSQPPRQDSNQDSVLGITSQKSVPEFGGWDQADAGSAQSLGYTIEFSQARDYQKQQKSDVWSSLGGDQDSMAVPSQSPRQDNNQDSQVATNARKSVPKFGGWDRLDAGSLGYTMEFSQARTSKKQQKSDVRSSLGCEKDLTNQPPRQDNYQDTSMATNTVKSVPEFGGWDRANPKSLGYTMEFSQARANRKQRKSDVRSSLGNEQEFIAALLPRQQVPHQLSCRPVSKRKRILAYIRSCLRP